MSDYYYNVWKDLESVGKNELIATILTEAIIPNLPVPPTAQWLDIVANGFHNARDYEKSVEWSTKALAYCKTQKEEYRCKTNISRSYLNLNQPEVTLEYCENLLEIEPTNFDVLMNKVVALYACNRKTEAKALLSSVLQRSDLTDNQRSTAMYNCGVHIIAEGNLLVGMQHLQLGRKSGIWGHNHHSFFIPLWTGVPKLNKSILFVGEGGIGDEFIFARFAKRVREMGMIPHIVSNHKISSEFLRMGFESVIDHTDTYKYLSKFDYWMPIMDAPIALRLNFDDLWHGPYVTVHPDYDKKWQSVIPDDNLIKIGIKWKGNPYYEASLHRDIPITDIVSLIDLNKYKIFSLQKDCLDDLTNTDNVTMLHDKLDTIEDLIAAIEQLDLVVTSCTSVAHISAAMGKPTIVLVPIMNYYVWAEPGTKSSWYGNNIHLLKQTKLRNWDDQLIELNCLLDQFDNTKNSF